MYIAISTTSDAKKDNLYRCEQELVKTSIDFCKISQNQGSFISKILMENFYRTANFELRCPFKVTNSNLTVTNFSITDRFLDFVIKANLKGVKKIVTAFRGKLSLRIVKN